MLEDIKEHDNARIAINKLKPYMDKETGKIITPEAKWYKYCIKYSDRYHR